MHPFQRFLGGLYYWTYKFAPPKVRNLLCWIVGYTNTISYITGVSGVDWSCAVLIMAAASIGSDGAFVPTVHQILYVRRFIARLYSLTYSSGVYCAVLMSHAFVASCATKVIARLQYIFIAINLASVRFSASLSVLMRIRLVLVMFIGLPASTPAEFKNNAKYAFGNFENCALRFRIFSC